MKKKIVFAILFAIFILPRLIDGVNAFTLRFITPPEAVMQRFYAEQDIKVGLAEDQLEDVLILAGAKMVPLLERDAVKKDVEGRLYVINALGLIGTEKSIHVLEQILRDENEIENYRAAALDAITRIDAVYGENIARQYVGNAEKNLIARRARKIVDRSLNGSIQQGYNGRTYWEAFRHAHD